MAISKDDVLEALGIQSGNNWVGPAAAAFGVGLIVGSVAALLLTPKSGAELREDVVSRLQRGRAGMKAEPMPPTV